MLIYKLLKKCLSPQFGPRHSECHAFLRSDISQTPEATATRGGCLPHLPTHRRPRPVASTRTSCPEAPAGCRGTLPNGYPRPTTDTSPTTEATCQQAVEQLPLPWWAWVPPCPAKPGSFRRAEWASCRLPSRTKQAQSRVQEALDKCCLEE